MAIEHGDLGGGICKAQKLGERSVSLCLGSHDGQMMLTISMRPKDLNIPIKPPMTLYGNRLNFGQLGMKFLKYQANCWDRAHKTLQVCLSCEEKEELAELHRLIASHLQRKSGIASKGQNCSGRVACKVLLPSNRANKKVSPVRSRSTNDSYSKRPDILSQEELPHLSAEQMKIFDLVVRQGKSIFFTGSAGTGKSLLLKNIIRALPASSTFVTGTTALAGCLLGGTTIHSYAGVGKGDGTLESMIRSASRGESASRWRQTKVLILDELSMMDGAFFDKIEEVARTLRRSNEPFGGIQLVLSGDYYQLPPVSKNPRERKFCFEAKCWSSCVNACVELKTVFRQSDNHFVDVLGQIRLGKVSANSIKSLLGDCFRPLEVEEGILPTQLFTHRADVDFLNKRELDSLPGTLKVYTSHDQGDLSVLEASCPAPKLLKLKVGAQVMLTRNLSSMKGLVNGSRGVVTRITPSGLPCVRFASQLIGEEPIVIERDRWTVSVGGCQVAQRSQFPLVLAWGITVHKSQGMSLDKLEVSLENAFEAGMAYVALSRARSMEGLFIKGEVSSQALRADPKVSAFYSSMI